MWGWPYPAGPLTLIGLVQPSRCLSDLCPSHLYLLIAAAHLVISRRALLDLVRQGHLPGHPLALGRRRHLWGFRLSELEMSLADKKASSPVPSISRSKNERSMVSDAGR